MLDRKSRMRQIKKFSQFNLVKISQTTIPVTNPFSLNLRPSTHSCISRCATSQPHLNVFASNSPTSCHCKCNRSHFISFSFPLISLNVQQELYDKNRHSHCIHNWKLWPHHQLQFPLIYRTFSYCRLRFSVVHPAFPSNLFLKLTYVVIHFTLLQQKLVPSALFSIKRAKKWHKSIKPLVYTTKAAVEIEKKM